jgi:hypothetical protein
MAIINVDTTVYKLVQTPAENVFTLTGGTLNTIAAANVSIVDEGNFFDSDEVEGALQEVGADVAAIDGNISTLQTDVSSLQISVTAIGETTTENSFAILDLQALTNAYPTSFTSKQFISAIQTLTISAGLIAWNMANGQRAKVTLTQSATLSNPTNATAAFPDLEVKQDATGGRVLSFGSNFVTPVGYVAAPTTANSYTLYHFQLRSDGKLSVAYTHYAS